MEIVFVTFKIMSGEKILKEKYIVLVIHYTIFLGCFLVSKWLSSKLNYGLQFLFG